MNHSIKHNKATEIIIITHNQPFYHLKGLTVHLPSSPAG